MVSSQFSAAMHRADTARRTPPYADERSGDDSGGSVIAAWAVFLVLFLVLLAAAVIDNTLSVG